MPSRITPPSLPLRQSDDNSKWLSYKLALAYPLLEGGNSIKNYGFWGTDGDLTLSNVTRQRGTDGLQALDFSNANAYATSSAITRSLSGPWAYAFWLKMDTAPTGSDIESIFSLRGPTENHVAAWADISGIWSWQKRDTADTYSVLPTSDFSLTKTMLVIASYEGTYLPPAQLRTKQSLSYHPSQPAVYASYNDGAGTAQQAITQIFLGNNDGLAQRFKGSIGPFYFWDRALAESEVWQLWQDPYAPFRRSLSQKVNLSTLSSSASNSLQGTGKLTGVRPILQDDNGLYINILDYYSYVDKPDEEIIATAQDDTGILINDSYFYQAVPSDVLSTDLVFLPQLTITISDSYTFQAIPSEDLTVPNTISPDTISISDSYSYQTLPTEALTAPGGTAPLDITLSDSYSYQTLPTEAVTVTTT